MSDPKIKYDISANVTGEDDVEKLSQTLRGMGDVLEGELRQSALDAAHALEALGSKQSTLEGFAQLRRESSELEKALAAATAQVDKLGAELPETSAKTLQLAQAEQQAVSQLKEAQAVQQRWKDSLASLRQETTGAARKTQEYREATAGLQLGLKAATNEVARHRATVAQSKDAANAARIAEKTLSDQYQQSLGAAGKLSAAHRESTAALTNSRAAMSAAGLSTQGLSEQQQRLREAVTGVKQRVLELAPAYQSAAGASSQSTQTQAQNHRTLREGMRDIGAELQRIQQIALIAVGGGYFGGLIKDVGQTADEFKNLQARIKLVTGEGPAFEASFDGVKTIALETNSALSESGELFGRLARAAKDGGASAEAAQDRALGLTRTINQTIQLSGASAEASKAAITQLIQGLQSGVLRGNEFNSVVEQAPRLSQAMANGLGVTVGQLREMATQGQLTAETVMGSLEGQSEAIAKEFATLPATVGRAIQNLSTQWTLYVGASDKGLISTQNAAKVIDGLANNLDVLVDSLTVAGKVWAAMKVAQMADNFAGWASKTLTATTAIEANSTATVANTAAHRANASAVTASAAAQTGAAAAAGKSAAATAANTAVQAMNAKSWGDLGSALGKVTLGHGELQRAATRSTVFTEAATAATSRHALGAAEAAGKVGLLGTAVKGVTGFLGGPVGLAVTLGMLAPEIKRFGTWIGESTAKLMGHGKGLKELEAQEKLAAVAAKEHAESQRRLALRQQEVRQASFDLTAQSKVLTAEFDKATKSGKSAGEAVEALGKSLDATSVEGIRAASGALTQLAADGKLTADQVRDAWAKALDGQDLVKFEVMARMAFSRAGEEADKLKDQLQKAIQSGASQEVIDGLRNRLQNAMSAAQTAGERMATVMDSVLTVAVQRTGLSFDVLQGKISETSRSALNDLDIIVNGMGELQAKGVDTGRVLEESLSKAISTADTQQAIDAVKSRLEELRTTLGTKATDGLLEKAKERAQELSDALDKARPGINSVREAMQKLGVDSNDSLKDVAKNAKEAYDEVVSSGKATERELSDAFKRAADAAIKAADGVAPEWVRMEASARGYRLEVDQAGDAMLTLADKARTGADGVEQAFARAGIQTTKQIQDQAKQAKADYNTILFSGKASAEGLETAFTKYANAAIKANGGVASEFLAAEAASHGLTIAYDKTGKAVVKSAAEMGSAMESAMQRGNKAIQEQIGYLDRLKARNDQIAQQNQDNRHNAGRKGSTGEELAPGVQEVGNTGQYRNKDNMSSDAKGNVIGGVESEAQMNQRIAKLFGEWAIGNKLAIDAANIKLKLDEAAQYGVAQVPGNGEYYANLNKEYARLLRLLEEQRGDTTGGKKPEPKEDKRQQATSSGMQAPDRQLTSTVNLYYNDQNVGTVKTDFDGGKTLQNFLRQLSSAKAAS